MTEQQARRAFLKTLSATALAALASNPLGALAGEPRLKLGEFKPFSFEALKAEAQRLVKLPARKANLPAPDITAQINYEKWGQITYNTD
jgi:glucans biosynthesis protein